MQTPDIGIYIHVPFCRIRCSYCDFATDLEKSGQRALYLEHLKQEILQSSFEGRVDSLYFGGGTPSLLTPPEIAEILTALQQKFEFSPIREVTLEANPEAVSPCRLKIWQQLGINRVSVGLQSLQQEELKFLGRGHLRDENLKALDSLKNAGINFNVDFMLGIPCQSLQTLQQSLEESGLESIPHISSYILSIEEEAPWFDAVQSGKIKTASEGLCGEMYQLMQTVLESAGLKQYEVSAFARPGQASHHNLKYWKNRPYLGFGPSAGSYIAQRRMQNQRKLHDWIQQVRQDQAPDFCATLSEQDAILETIMLNFRLLEGVHVSQYELWQAMHPELKLNQRLSRLKELKLLELSNETYRIPRDRLLWANRVYGEYLD